MSKLRDWLDHRTGYRHLRFKFLYERIPGGPKWRYVWGSSLAFTFTVQLLTGFFLWTAYSPSAQTAWESVYFIQYHMQLGWFVRGLHHYASQAMVILLALHLLQVVIAGAYRPPREVNWWLGLLLMFVVLGLSLTGYLLPWDEKGYWATQVTTKIIGIVPILGPTLEHLLVGGPAYGHHTLTRFFAFHAGLLPTLLVLILVAHVALFRRHGVTHPKNPQGETTFWPEQALRDTLACLGVLLVLVGLVVWGGSEKGFVFGPEGGASLQAPADASNPYPAARPEWYFLFLYQFLKYFPGESEVYGAIVIPCVMIGVLVLFPFLGRLQWGHAFCVGMTFALLTGVIFLSVAAIREDKADFLYQKGVADAQRKARRAIELAHSEGIPTQGAVELLRRDPLTQGPTLFRDNCATCHRWDGHDGTGLPVVEIRDSKKVRLPSSASDLAGFGRQEWISELLKNPSAARFFGNTEHKDGEMAEWSKKNISLMSREEIDAVAAFLAVQTQAAKVPRPDADLVARGAEVFAFGSWEGAQACSECHTLKHPDIPMSGEMVAAPDLTDYASKAWLHGIITDPTDPEYYGERNDRMPKFSERLTPQELQLLIEWMWAEAHSLTPYRP